MERWVGKVAVVTGASAGIGEAIVINLLKHGMIVVGLARREEKLQKIKSDLETSLRSRFHPLKCDLTKEEEIRSSFAWIKSNLGGVDVLVNNAGILKPGALLDKNHTQSIKDVLDTNVMAVVYCTQEAFASMKERNFDGHIIVINSVLGHINHPEVTILNMYTPSKHALTTMVELYRQEFLKAGTKVKMTSISPGCVESEMSSGYGPEVPKLRAESIADAVAYVVGTPPEVQVHEMIIKPIGEAF